ncbi:MAG: PQQ-like beta-propeller repeat protein [Planctomycetes bacterium]|nr:PQQ-like beta-propeller repeat protein [Planctomycetota bacterium]
MNFSVTPVPLVFALALAVPRALPGQELAAPAANASESRSEGATWPQWRGPARDGHFRGAAWPERLNAEKVKRLWRVELDKSYASPVVSETTVFTVETKSEEEEVVKAFSRAEGKLLWQTSWKGAMTVPFFAARNGSWVRSSPAFDGNSLYVGGMRDVLVCLDAVSGEIRWRLDFPEQMKTKLPDFGFVCSPLVVGDHLYVQAGEGLAKVEKKTGKVVWRGLRDGGGMNGSAFSSPVLAKLAGQEQLVVLSRTHLHGVDLAEGKSLWSLEVPSFRGMNILTPQIVGDDGVFTAPYGGKSQLVKLSASDDGISAAPAWQNKIQGYMCSPVVVDGHAYYFTRANRFTCVRLADGEERWTSGPTGNEYWSLIAQGRRILALSNDGELRLLEANPEAYTVIDELPLVEAESWAHLAAVDGLLVIRELKALSCFAWK